MARAFAIRDILPRGHPYNNTHTDSELLQEAAIQLHWMSKADMVKDRVSANSDGVFIYEELHKVAKWCNWPMGTSGAFKPHQPVGEFFSGIPIGTSIPIGTIR